MAVESFRELFVWQRAMELTVAVYSLTKQLPRDEIYGLTSQIRRAAVSIPSNIAEGQSRRTTGEFMNFLSIARGSNAEVQTQLILIRTLKMAEPEQISQCEGLTIEVAKMLNSLMNSLA